MDTHNMWNSKTEQNSLRKVCVKLQFKFSATVLLMTTGNPLHALYANRSPTIILGLSKTWAIEKDPLVVEHGNHENWIVDL